MSASKNIEIEKSNVSDTQRQIAELDAAIQKFSERLEAMPEVSAPREDVVSDTVKRKMTVIFAVMTVIMVTFLYSSYAYFTATVGSAGNTITAGKAFVEFVEVSDTGAGGSFGEGGIERLSIFPGTDVMGDVAAVNSGVVSLYVRAIIYSDITLDERYQHRASEIDEDHLVFKINDTDWIKQGDYWYYNKAIDFNEKTTKFINGITFSKDMGNIYKDSVVNVKVRFEVVQANGNGDTPFEAVGWPTLSEGGASS